MREPTAEVFLRDVAEHRMNVLRADELYRHLRFSKLDNGWHHWFELMTWPGCLVIRGDMGTWTFSRLEDMFRFFRSSREGLNINCSYWAEKLQHGPSGSGKIEKIYDQQRFQEALLAQLSDYYDFQGCDLAELTQAVKDDVFLYDNEWECKIAARDFSYKFADGRKFHFDSTELPSGKDYSYHFVWCLYAIVWGIQQWDAAQAVSERPQVPDSQTQGVVANE